MICLQGLVDMGKRFKSQITRVRITSGTLIGDASIEISVQCLNCEHFDTSRGVACKAFPGGIPEPIRLGDFDHSDEFEGDNGVRFKGRFGLTINDLTTIAR
jgi:hypothetical protein